MDIQQYTLKLIDKYFQTRKFEIFPNDNTTTLSEANILSQKNDTLEVNINSIFFNKLLLEYIEEKTNQKLPLQIKEAFAFIDKFEGSKKKESGYKNLINAYSILIDGLKSYVCYLFHTNNSMNIIEYFKSLKDTEKHYFEQYLFQSILWIDNIDVNVIYELLSSPNTKDIISTAPDFVER